MVLIAILILIGYRATIQVDTLKFVACITGTIKSSTRTQITEFHANNGTATPYFDVLPVQYATWLSFKFYGYTFFQVASGYHMVIAPSGATHCVPTFIVVSRVQLVIGLRP